MRTKTLGILSAGMLLGLTLLSTSYAQDDGATVQDDHRGFRGMHGRGMEGMRGRGMADMEGMRDRFGRGGRGGSPEQFIARHDTDGDDQVSLGEFVDEQLERVDGIFERRDDNGDGLISLEENTPPARPDRPNRPGIDRDAVAACVRETIADYEPGTAPDSDDRFEDADTDGDGALSLSEVSAGIEARADAQFGRIDTDASGFITASELEAHAAALREVRRTVRDCARSEA